ncbi:hypothetical protein KRR26_24995 [Corallococcus sp. M34]|uniref:hypothetical protein n=1 Tax=Citreicoccus inhibens TaxID=2849499 RepID=UPI001C22AA2A|nr:hypothetical protein [Citreicoccus inhibens]MBU8898873.1 hypothetical protein [Citreicoccus inhibens]
MSNPTPESPPSPAPAPSGAPPAEQHDLRDEAWERSRGLTRGSGRKLWLGALLFALASVMGRVATRRESYVEDVQAVVISGRERLKHCGSVDPGSRVTARLVLDGNGGARATVEGALAGTVAGRCVEEELSRLAYPKRTGLPVTVALSLDAR